MFSVPHPNLIESTDGFSVEVVDETAIRYLERGRKLQILSELLPGPRGMIIYADSIERWEEPHQEEELGNADRLRVIDKVQAALKFQGCNSEVITFYSW